MKKIIVTLSNRHRVAITSDSLLLMDTLLSDYAPHCRWAVGLEEPSLPTLTLTEQEGEFLVAEGDDRWISPFPIQEVSDFVSRHLAMDSSLFMLHGSAVEYDGKAHLFLAVSGSGKTTLSSYLSEMGFPYVAEDCIYLDRQSLMVLPYYRPIHMREGGMAVLRGQGLHPNANWDPLLERYVVHPKQICNKPLPIGRIFFIERNGKSNKTLPLSQTERIPLLLHAPRAAYPMNREYLTFITELSRKECCRLLYRDLDFVKNILHNNI